MMMNFFVVWLTNQKHSALLPAGTIVKDPYHRKFLTISKHDLNLRTAVVQTLWNGVVQ